MSQCTAQAPRPLTAIYFFIYFFFFLSGACLCCFGIFPNLSQSICVMRKLQLIPCRSVLMNVSVDDKTEAAHGTQYLHHRTLPHPHWRRPFAVGNGNNPHSRNRLGINFIYTYIFFFFLLLPPLLMKLLLLLLLLLSFCES